MTRAGRGVVDGGKSRGESLGVSVDKQVLASPTILSVRCLASRMFRMTFAVLSEARSRPLSGRRFPDTVAGVVRFCTCTEVTSRYVSITATSALLRVASFRPLDATALTTTSLTIFCYTIRPVLGSVARSRRVARIRVGGFFSTLAVGRGTASRRLAGLSTLLELPFDIVVGYNVTPASYLSPAISATADSIRCPVHLTAALLAAKICSVINGITGGRGYSVRTISAPNVASFLSLVSS